MKLAASTLLFAAAVNAHTIFQKVFVNGADQGLLAGLRAPSNNNPIQSTSDSGLACGASGSTSSKVINVKAGDTIGTYWQHVIGGPQGSNDADNPIAKSHKGPIQVYLAKVDNAASASSSGQRWFKVASEGLNGGVWAVDKMIQNNGLWSFTLPSCIAPGQYLMRGELLALHSAGSQNGEQFYISCAQINVTSGGSFSPSSTVSFPGAYSPTDPGILISIYGQSGQPDNGGRSYTAPGPAVISCNGSNNGGGQTTNNNGGGQTSTNNNSGGGAPLYGQCGGQGWTGPTTCAQGTCKSSGQYYSQCVP